MARVMYMYGIKDYIEWLFNVLIRMFIAITVISFYNDWLVTLVMLYWSLGRFIKEIAIAFKDIYIGDYKRATRE